MTPDDEKTNADAPEPVLVPHTEIDADTLRRVVESFILREGTDYGEREVPLERKLAQLYAQLERGEAQILFDPHSESIDIVSVPRGTRRR